MTRGPGAVILPVDGYSLYLVRQYRKVKKVEPKKYPQWSVQGLIEQGYTPEHSRQFMESEAKQTRTAKAGQTARRRGTAQARAKRSSDGSGNGQAK